MPQQKQSGHHKTYGPKMKDPRISASKEHRHRGPLGYYVRACEAGRRHVFTTRAEWLERGRR